MNKKTFFQNLKDQNITIKILSPFIHKYFNISRKIEKIQTNSLKFEGGSWLYFKDIISLTESGFKMKNGEDPIIYDIERRKQL